MAHRASNEALTPVEITADVNKISVSDSADVTTCAACGKPATMMCSGCVEDEADETVQTIRTYYCNDTCQKSHRPKHRVECQRLQSYRALLRASEMARDAFYIWRAKLFDWNIFAVMHNADKLLLLGKPLIGRKLFYPFPSSLLKDRADRYAALTFLECTTCISHFHQLLDQMIHDLMKPYSALELMVRLTEVPRATALSCVGADEERFSQDKYIHQLYKVTLKHGGEYAVDLTSAQYGIQKTVIGWEEYEREFKPVIGKISPFGSQEIRGPYRAPALSSRARKRETTQIGCELIVANYLRIEILKWELRNGNLTSMIKLPKKAFISYKATFLGAVKRGVLIGHGRLHIPDGFLTLLTDGTSSIREIAPANELPEGVWTDPQTGKEYVEVEERSWV